MRRDVPVERVFFAIVLGVSLLLLSLAMLRSDMASSTHSTRTFRDGFIVAEPVTRRTETASPVDSVVVETANKNDLVAMQRTNADGTAIATATIEKAGAPAPAAAAIHVSGDDAHTTTIKMEDGDEITIKRAGTSKNKITTISTHEDGKITIENRDKTKDSTAAAAVDGTLSPGQQNDKNESDTMATAVKKDAESPAEEADKKAATARAVDFVGAYEEKDEDTDFAEAGAAEDVVTLAGDSEEKAGDNTHEIVLGKKKVTLTTVGRSQTKVSLSNVDDEAGKPTSGR